MERGKMIILKNYEVVGQGATTKIYRDGGKAIKLYVNAPADEAENEAERQRFAYNAGLPVPAVFGVRRFDENSVALEMQYLNAQPLIRPQMDKDDRRNAINILVKLQCDVHRIRASNFPKQADRLAWKIKQTTYLSEAVKNRLLALLSKLDSSTVNLCHGDFHPLNILHDGTKYWIIDWVDATAGNPLADACRTYLIFLEHLKRSAGIYMRAFCNTADVDPSVVLAWLPVVAGARLNENMDEKSRKWLQDLIN
jgi:aminoglycoside phosphotransferase (APT) family kinase protein